MDTSTMSLLLSTTVDKHDTASDEDDQNCLVDLHGTCLTLPFHREGLAYFSLMVLALYLCCKILSRMGARELNAPHPQTSTPEWHLLLGRLGLVFFTFGTALDHFRLWVGSFDESWPDYILHADGHNATLANERWVRNAYRGAGIQTFLWWYCCFLVILLSPLTLYSITYIYWKARLRAGWQVSRTPYFKTTTVVSFVLVLAGLVAFGVGPLFAPLEVISVTRLWSLTTSTTISPLWLNCGTYAWQASLVGLACGLLVTEGEQRKFGNGVMLLVNILYVICSSSIAVSTESWWFVVDKLLQQAAIATQIWADIVHNPDDYGILHDDFFHHQRQQQALREPLLPRQGGDNEEEESDEEESDSEEDSDEESESSSSSQGEGDEEQAAAAADGYMELVQDDDSVDSHEEEDVERQEPRDEHVSPQVMLVDQQNDDDDLHEQQADVERHHESSPAGEEEQQESPARVLFSPDTQEPQSQPDDIEQQQQQVSPVRRDVALVDELSSSIHNDDDEPAPAAVQANEEILWL